MSVDNLVDDVVELNPLDLNDLEAHLAGEDEELVKWLNSGPGSVASVERYIASAMQQWQQGSPKLTFGIRLRHQRILIGTIDVDLEPNFLPPWQANLAYGIYPAWRRRGLATRSVRIACDYLRTLPHIDTAVIRAARANPVSIAVALRAGFAHAGGRMDGTEGTDMQVLRRDVRS